MCICIHGHITFLAHSFSSEQNKASNTSSWKKIIYMEKEEKYPGENKNLFRNMSGL